MWGASQREPDNGFVSRTLPSALDKVDAHRTGCLASGELLLGLLLSIFATCCLFNNLCILRWEYAAALFVKSVSFVLVWFDSEVGSSPKNTCRRCCTGCWRPAVRRGCLCLRRSSGSWGRCWPSPAAAPRWGTDCSLCRSHLTGHRHDSEEIRHMPGSRKVRRFNSVKFITVILAYLQIHWNGWQCQRPGS